MSLQRSHLVKDTRVLRRHPDKALELLSSKSSFWPERRAFSCSTDRSQQREYCCASPHRNTYQGKGHSQSLCRVVTDWLSARGSATGQAVYVIRVAPPPSSTAKAVPWPNGSQQGDLAQLFHHLTGSIPAGRLILRVSHG